MALESKSLAKHFVSDTYCMLSFCTLLLVSKKLVPTKKHLTYVAPVHVSLAETTAVVVDLA